MTPAVTPLDGSLFGPGQPCFGCSPDHPAGFRLRFTVDGDDVVTKVTPGPHHQGPLGLLHGGLAATIADEVAAWAVLAGTGKFGFTTSFSARLAKGLRVGVEVEGRGRLTNVTSRVVKATAELRQEGALCFAGDFVFVLLDRAAAEKLLGTALPPEWARFCR